MSMSISCSNLGPNCAQSCQFTLSVLKWVAGTPIAWLEGNSKAVLLFALFDFVDLLSWPKERRISLVLHYDRIVS